MADESRNKLPSDRILDDGNKLLSQGAFSEVLARCQSLFENSQDKKTTQNHAQKILSKFSLISNLYDTYITAMDVPPSTVLPKRTLDQVMSKHPVPGFRNGVKTLQQRLNTTAKARQKAHQSYVHGDRERALTSYLNAVPNSLASATFVPILVSKTPDGYNLYRAGEHFFAVSSRHKNIRYFKDTAYVLEENHPQTWLSRIKSDSLRFIYFNLAMPLYHLWQNTLRKVVVKFFLALNRYKILFAQLYEARPLGRKIPTVTAPNLDRLKAKIASGYDSSEGKSN